MCVCVRVCVYVCVWRERRERGGGERETVKDKIPSRLMLPQAKFMPHTGDSVLVTAARDGQVRCHVLSTSGNLMTSKRVSHHRDSAHKVYYMLVD